MSDREWSYYLNDMITFAEKVLSYTSRLLFAHRKN